MAGKILDEDEYKSIEQIVARVAQLSQSIQSLKKDILQSNPLPPTSSLQASAQILQHNLSTVLESVTDNSELLSRVAIHPSTNYPGRTQENVLTQLLRKKLEPNVEELVVRGREMAGLLEATTATTSSLADGKQEESGTGRGGGERLATVLKEDVWGELRQWTHGRIAKYVRDESGDVYTAEERDSGIEKVRTGLKRSLDEDSEDEDDENEDNDGDLGEDIEARVEDTTNETVVGDHLAGQDVREGPELETLLWFLTRGDFDVPRSVEYSRKNGGKRGLDGVNVPPEPMQDVSS